MSLLIIVLPPAGAGLSAGYEFVQSADGLQATKPAGPASVSAALLPAPTAGTEVVVVIASAALSWHSIELPAGLSATSPRLRAVLAGLLEDQLLSDEESFHFALAPLPGTAPGGKTWVAVCDKAWLQGHLQTLEAAQRLPGRLVPEFSPETGPLPLHAIASVDGACWVMTGDAVGGLMRLPFSSAALAVLPKTDSPQAAQVFAEPALIAQAEQSTQASVSLATRQQRWLDAARSPWDLAQFDLAQNKRARTLKKIGSLAISLLRERQWRPARWGVAMLLLANLVGLNVWAWQQKAQLQNVRGAIQSSLTQTFPGVKVVVDAPVQMQREVNLLRQASGALGSADLEAMLGAVGAAAPGSNISSIDYSPGELRLKGMANSPQDTQSAASALKAKGYNAQVEADLFLVKLSDRTTP